MHVIEVFIKENMQQMFCDSSFKSQFDDIIRRLSSAKNETNHYNLARPQYKT
jgi:hypothetical protein